MQYLVPLGRQLRLRRRRTLFPPVPEHLRTTQFCSRWNQPDQPARLAYQTLVLQWMAAFAAICMVVLLTRIYAGGGLLAFGLYSLGASAVLAWIVGTVQFHARIGCVQVDGTTFHILSMYDLAFGAEANPPFPLSFAAPQVTTDGLQIHYLDRVVTLRRQDFAQFESLAQQFLHPPMDPVEMRNEQ